MIKDSSAITQVELQKTDAIKDIIDINDAIMNNASNKVYRSKFLNSIKCPIESSLYLATTQQIGSEFDLKDSGKFKADSHFSIGNQKDLVNIMSLLVSFDASGEQQSCTTALPTMIKNFTEGACLHTGYPKRAVRHGMDPQCPSI
jgi:hypothetical protein